MKDDIELIRRALEELPLELDDLACDAIDALDRVGGVGDRGRDLIAVKLERRAKELDRCVFSRYSYSLAAADDRELMTEAAKLLRGAT